MITKTQGFSLIEVLVVITAVILISGFGFISLVFTQRRQTVDQSAFDIKQFIERAKYNTQSRVKPVDDAIFNSACLQKVPYGYEIDIQQTEVVMNVLCKDSGSTTIYASTVPYLRKQFPTQLTIVRNGCLKFRFDVTTNAVSCSNPSENLPSEITISLSQGGYQKKLIIDESGNVGIQ